MTTIVRLSKAGYYADFVFYPMLLLLLAGGAVDRDSPVNGLIWLLLCGIGVVSWTLVEYWLHRIAFHHIAPFRRLHDLHHNAPTAKIGTPTWVTASLICGGMLLPLWLEGGFNLASGLTSGLVAGYLWYVTAHHAAHHWRAYPDSYLHRVKQRHARHHHAGYPCYFGVTTIFWDQVFGTNRGNGMKRHELGSARPRPTASVGTDICDRLRFVGVEIPEHSCFRRIAFPNLDRPS